MSDKDDCEECGESTAPGGQETMGVVGIVRVVVEYFEVVEVCKGF